MFEVKNINVERRGMIKFSHFHGPVSVLATQCKREWPGLFSSKNRISFKSLKL